MKKLLTALLLMTSSYASATMIIETIQLKFRPTDEIIPIIKPMLAPDASITGTGYKLIIKSTPENIQQIQAFLEKIDVNQNLLRVYVSMNRDTVNKERRDSVSVNAGNDTTSIKINPDPNNQNSIKAKIQDKSSSNVNPNIQLMSVAEGYWASISMGQSIPISKRTRNPDGTVTETIVYKDIMTGYHVMPRTHGNKVTLTIKPISQSVSDGAITTTEMETTVTGNLGEWLFLGGTNQAENLRNSGIGTRTRIRSTDVNQVWVKVERP